MPDEIPAITISVAEHIKVGETVNWLPQVMKDTKLAKSTSEAIRLIKQGGVKLNDTTVTDPNMNLTWGENIIKVGKRRFYKVIVE